MCKRKPRFPFMKRLILHFEDKLPEAAANIAISCLPWMLHLYPLVSHTDKLMQIQAV
jgi:hypothetical protein